jgi:hypothetical protein
MAVSQQSEMGTLSMRPCPKDTHSLPTPPNSPSPLPKGLRRQVSRFRLPKILRRTQTVESTVAVTDRKPFNNTFSSYGDQGCSKQDKIGPAPYRPISTSKHANPPTLPVTQTCFPTGKSLAINTSKKLRIMPKSCRDLRAYTCDLQPRSQLPKLPAKAPSLLPSPLNTGDVESPKYNGSFAFQNPKEVGLARVAELSYEYQGIVAGYCEDVFLDNSHGLECTSTGRNLQRQTPATPPQRPKIPHTSDVVRIPPTSNMSATLRSPKRDRSSSLSSEAMWLSRSFASPDPVTSVGQLEKIKMNEKRLAEKSRRCCQVVQGPADDMSIPWIGERKAVGEVEACVKHLNANHILVLCHCYQAWESKRYLGAAVELHESTNSQTMQPG